MEKVDFSQELTKLLKEHFETLQDRPDQYVVGIYRVSDGSLIGYHLSTMCQVTHDILEAKRYSGTEPYEQIKIIHKNIAYAIDLNEAESEKHFFGQHLKAIKQEFYAGMTSKDFYLDAIYLNPNTPKQSFRYVVMEP